MRKFEHGRLRFSPTDLVNYLSCRHLTGLNWEHGHKHRESPRFKDEAKVAKHGYPHCARRTTLPKINPAILSSRLPRSPRLHGQAEAEDVMDENRPLRKPNTQGAPNGS